MNGLKRYPLWLLVSCAVGISILLIGVISSLLIRSMEREYLFQSIQKEARKNFSLLSAASIDAIITEDGPLLQTVIDETIQTDRQIIKIRIENEEGKLLAEWSAPNRTDQSMLKEFSEKFVYEGEVFGKITMIRDLQEHYNNIGDHVFRISFAFAITLLTQTLIIGICLHYLVIRPIRRIDNRLNELADGDFQSRLEIITSSELNHLGESTNRLGDVLLQIRREISDRMLAEAMSHEISQKFQSLITASPLAIITMDQHERVNVWNPSATTIFGWQQSEIIGRALPFFVNEEKRLFDDYFQQTLKGKSFTNVELQGAKKSRQSMNLSLSFAPLPNMNKQVIGVILVISDITDRMRTEEKMRRSYEAGIAENAISVLHNIGNAITPAILLVEDLIGKQSKSRLSHYLNLFRNKLMEHLQTGDLNSFLSEDPKGKQMLDFFGNLIEQGEHENSTSSDYLEKIDNHLRHISDIIQLQQRYANGQPVEESFRIAATINDVLNMLGGSFKKRNINIIREVTDDLPPIVCDKNKLVQVLINLLKNAMESIDEKRRDQPNYKARIELHGSLTSNDHIEISIVDNGMGATEETLSTAFKFGKSTKQRGSGFGLHDCANFIRSRDGEIRFHSKGLGKGATVQFCLPTSQNPTEKSEYLLDTTASSFQPNL